MLERDSNYGWIEEDGLDFGERMFFLCEDKEESCDHILTHRQVC